MNMFYIHSVAPSATYYLHWVVDHHCGADIHELLDLSECTWIRPVTGLRRCPGELWASTSISNRTRWDNLDKWTCHSRIVSISFHLYAFVPLTFCRDTFLQLKRREPVLRAIQEKQAGPWAGRPFISVRKGDLLHVLQTMESDPMIEQRITDALATSPYSAYIYDQKIVNRGRDQVIDAMADLIFLSQYADIRGYCPYSWFSSWIYLLSPKFSSANPVFDFRVHDVVFV
jgi:hypothetical protein